MSETSVRFFIKDSGGTPIPNAQVDVALSDVGIGEVIGSITLPTAVTGVTGDSGYLTIKLNPVANVPYTAVVFDPVSKRRGIFEFFVYETAEVIDVDQIALLPPPSAITYDALAMAKISENLHASELLIADLESYNGGRVEPSELQFVPVLSVQTGFVTVDHNNSLFEINELNGNVVIPSNDTHPLPIGTTIDFIKHPDQKNIDIDIDFIPEDSTIEIDFLSDTVTGSKLQFDTDVMRLVRFSVDPVTQVTTWKAYHIGGSGAGGNVDADIAEVNTAIGTDAPVGGGLGGLQYQVSALEAHRLAFNARLDTLEANDVTRYNSILSLTASITSLTAILADVNAYIDERVTTAIPGLGDLTASVAAAQLAETNAEIAEDNAALSETAAVQAVADITVIQTDIDNTQTSINNVHTTINNTFNSLNAEGAWSVTSLINLKALDVSKANHVFMEGQIGPGDAFPSHYSYFPADMTAENLVTLDVIRPNSVANDTLPGRWLRISIRNHQFVDNELSLDKLNTITTGTLLGNNDGVDSAPEALSAADAKTLLAIAQGDVASLVGDLATMVAATAAAQAQATANAAAIAAIDVPYIKITEDLTGVALNAAGYEAPTVFSDFNIANNYQWVELCFEQIGIDGEHTIYLFLTHDNGATWTGGFDIGQGASNWIDFASVKISTWNYQRLGGDTPYWAHGAYSFAHGADIDPNSVREEIQFLSPILSPATGFKLYKEGDAISLNNFRMYGLKN